MGKPYDNCRKCGKELTKKDKRSKRAYCSAECKGSRVFVLVSCCVCGSSLQRSKNAIARRNRFCCGLQCQRKLALFENRGSARRLSRQAIAIRAKENWSKKRRLQRLRSNPWRSLVISKLYCIERDAVAFNWYQAIYRRVNVKRPRIVGRFNKQLKYSCFKIAVYHSLNRLYQKEKYYAKSEWAKKIQNKLSNYATKLRMKSEERKNEKAGGCFFGFGETRKQSTQMCFDWLGVDA